MDSPPSQIKITLIGASGAGKTSLRQQFLSSTFAQSFRTTIGTDFISKSLTVDGHRVSLSIWDTAGQERFRSLANAFYRGSDACVLVYSRTDPDSLAALRGWFDEFALKCPVDDRDRRAFCWIAVGNKADLDQGAISHREVDDLLSSLLPPLLEKDSGARGYDVDGPASAATASAPLGSVDDAAHPPERHHRAHSTTIEVLPPLESNHPHEAARPRLPAAGRHLSLAASRSASDTGTYHSARSSMHDSLSAQSASFHSAASFQSSTSTVRPPPSPSSTSSSSSSSSFIPDEYFAQPEALSQRQRDLERAHGIDIFMATSPPRAPAQGLPQGRFSVYRNPHERLLRAAADDVTVTPRTPDPAAPLRVTGVLDDDDDDEDDAGSSKAAEVEDDHDYAQDGIKHFSTSAKTGEGVHAVFEYAVRRVLWRWALERREDEEESERARRAEQVIEVGGRESGRKGWREACCS